MITLLPKGPKIERQTTIQTGKFVHGPHPRPPTWILTELIPPPFFKSLKSNQTLEVRNRLSECSAAARLTAHRCR